MKKITISIILIFSLLILSACPKQSVVRQAAKASFQLSGLTVDAVNATGKAYQANLLSAETKNRIADALKKIATGGKRFNQHLEMYFRNHGENIPSDKLEILNAIFSDEVVVPFLEILQALKVLSANDAGYLHSAINALRTAILIISNGFAAVKTQNTGEVFRYV